MRVVPGQLVQALIEGEGLFEELLGHGVLALFAPIRDRRHREHRHGVGALDDHVQRPRLAVERLLGFDESGRGPALLSPQQPGGDGQGEHQDRQDGGDGGPVPPDPARRPVE